MDATERARLVEQHLHLSRRAASMIFPRVRGYVELEELIALGNAGLAEAAQRFEPDRGVTFATFGWYRVQGAIVDGLRRMTQLPRRTWTKLLALQAAGAYLEHRADRDHGAATQGIPPASGPDALEAVKTAMSAIRTIYLTSLEAMRDQGFDPATESPTPAQRLDTSRLAARLREAITTLPERERALLTKHYFEGKNLLEAGAELGISKSWASRLHAQAVDRLRALVDDS